MAARAEEEWQRRLEAEVSPLREEAELDGARGTAAVARGAAYERHSARLELRVPQPRPKTPKPRESQNYCRIKIIIKPIDNCHSFLLLLLF